MAAPLAFALLVRQKILDDESALAGSKRSAAAKASHLAVFHASRSFHADNIVFLGGGVSIPRSGEWSLLKSTVAPFEISEHLQNSNSANFAYSSKTVMEQSYTISPLGGERPASGRPATEPTYLLGTHSAPILAAY